MRVRTCMHACVHSKVLPRTSSNGNVVDPVEGEDWFLFFSLSLFSPSPFSVRLDSRLTGMIAFSWTRMGSFLLVAARDPPSRNNRRGKERPPWKKKKKEGKKRNVCRRNRLFRDSCGHSKGPWNEARKRTCVTRRLRGPRIVVDSCRDATNVAFHPNSFLFPHYLEDRSPPILIIIQMRKDIFRGRRFFPNARVQDSIIFVEKSWRLGLFIIRRRRSNEAGQGFCRSFARGLHFVSLE